MKRNTRNLVAISAGLLIGSVCHSQIITTIAGGGSSGIGDGGPANAAQLYSPYLMAVDASDNLYIADYSHYEIRKVDKTTGIITAFAGNGTQNTTGDGGPATAAQLNDPRSVVFDPTGNMYMATGNRIRKVSTTGIITTFAGNDTADYKGDGGQASIAKFNGPTGLAIDGSGNLLIADNGNYVIRKIDLGTGIVSTVIGNGNSGFNGDGGPATAAEIGTPYDVAVDAGGNIFITDNGNMRIRKIANASGIISTVAGNGGITYAGDGSLATATGLYNPDGLTIDKTTGDIIFADEKNNSVRRISAGTGIITTLAGLGYSTPGFSGDGGTATAAELTEPYGVTLNSSGSLYISDWYNNRIRMITHVTGINEISDSKEVQVYPVPNIGDFNVNLVGEGYSSLKIVNVLGQEVYAQSVDSKKQNPHILINGLCVPNGVYFLQAASQQGVGIKRIVIQK